MGLSIESNVPQTEGPIKDRKTNFCGDDEKTHEHLLCECEAVSNLIKDQRG